MRLQILCLKNRFFVKKGINIIAIKKQKNKIEREEILKKALT